MSEAETGIGTGGQMVHRARELRASWGRRSREEGWEGPENWWTPSVNTLCEAHVAGADLTTSCGRLGEARAQAGVGIGPALTDLDAFTRSLGWERTPPSLVRSLAEGWERGGPGRGDYLDPLTGLADRAYLRTRLGELYRGVEDGVPAAFTHRLVVIALDPSLDPWRRAARSIVLSHELRRFFTDGESVCLVNRFRIAVLTLDGPSLSAELDELREETCWGHGAAVWSISLPGTHQESLALIEALNGGGDRSDE